MTKQDKDEITDIVVTVIQNVVIPVLAEHSDKLDSLKETVYSHSVSLMKLEKFTAETYYEVKSMRLELHDHAARIERLENSLI